VSDRDLSIDTLASSLARSPPAIARAICMTVYKVVRCIVQYGVSYRTVYRAVRCIVLLFTTPVILYGLEVTQPQKSVITMLNNLINRAVYKILKYLIKTLFVISDSKLDCMI